MSIMAKKNPTKEQRDHWNLVIETGPHPALAMYPGRRTIHHVSGGSIKDIGLYVGMGQKQNHWLVVCLPESLHTGQQGIDSGYGVRSWERDFLTQLDIVEWTARQTGVNVFEKAGSDYEFEIC